MNPNKLIYIFLLSFSSFFNNPFIFAKEKEEKSIKSFGPTKIIKKETWHDDFYNALNYYEKKKYYKAVKIFDDIIPFMVLSDEIIDARLKQAYCNYYLSDFTASIYQFEEFYNDYPLKEQAEEALYMYALSLSKLSPSIHLEQTYTENAIDAFKLYFKKYPEGKFRDEARENLKKMNIKLFNKTIDIAETYYKLEYYNAAKLTLDYVINEAPTKELEINAKWLMLNILFYDAHKTKIEWPKWINALEYCLEFISDFPDCKYFKKAKKLYKKIPKQIKK